MKKNILIILSAVILLGVAGFFYYSNQNEEKATNNKEQFSQEQNTDSINKDDIRKAVWEHLPNDQQELTRSTWKDAKVQTITLNDTANVTGELIESYTDKEVYMVDFTTTGKAIPNNIIVIVDKDTFEIIGYGLVD